MRNVTPDESIKMLRSLGELYCEHIQHHAPALARHLHRKINEQCAIDLSEHNCVIERIMEAEICVWANAVLDAIQKCVKDQVDEAGRKIRAPAIRKDSVESTASPIPNPGSPLTLLLGCRIDLLNEDYSGISVVSLISTNRWKMFYDIFDAISGYG